MKNVNLFIEPEGPFDRHQSFGFPSKKSVTGVSVIPILSLLASFIVPAWYPAMPASDVQPLPLAAAARSTSHRF
jgi:hypothetical protein